MGDGYSRIILVEFDDVLSRGPIRSSLFASLAAWFLLPIPAGPLRAADRTEAIVVDARKQLFLDDFLISNSRGVKRIIHPAQKFQGNPVLDTGYIYGSVIREGGKYRMWYFARPGVGYAESPDGIHWTRPELGLIRIGGKNTNLVLGRKYGDGNRRDLPPQDTLDTANLIGARNDRELPAAERGEVALPYFYEPYGVYRDERERDPARRYKMGFNDVDFQHTGDGGDPFHKGQRRGLGVAASGDGIHWKLVDNWATESIIDGGTHWMYDAERRKYILYGRTKFQPPAQVTAWGIDGPPTVRMAPSLHEWLQAHFWGRAVARVESSDFVHWNITEPAKAPIVMTTDLEDRPGDEAYDMEVFPYGRERLHRPAQGISQCAGRSDARCTTHGKPRHVSLHACRRPESVPHFGIDWFVGPVQSIDLDQWSDSGKATTCALIMAGRRDGIFRMRARTARRGSDRIRDHSEGPLCLPGGLIRWRRNSDQAGETGGHVAHQRQVRFRGRFSLRCWMAAGIRWPNRSRCAGTRWTFRWNGRRRRTRKKLRSPWRCASC